MDELPDGDEPDPLTTDPEAPEADALEQSELVEVRQALDPLSRDPEAPEADALDQAEIVIDVDQDDES